MNNVRYVRWIETARIRYAESLELPGGQVRGMLVSQTTVHVIYPSQSRVKDEGKGRERGRKLISRAEKELDSY